MILLFLPLLVFIPLLCILSFMVVVERRARPHRPERDRRTLPACLCRFLR